ncbi:unnamed protein product [Haemonchus placei]|uniref:SynN domain-containing protein n=1 Tax=Haemonchus placei TaxID=6290 RepID=A0A0N4WCB6_HAEPC|nr:unnamed protein product [Haemonchus placei]
MLSQGKTTNIQPKLGAVALVQEELQPVLGQITRLFRDKQKEVREQKAVRPHTKGAGHIDQSRQRSSRTAEPPLCKGRQRKLKVVAVGEEGHGSAKQIEKFLERIKETSNKIKEVDSKIATCQADESSRYEALSNSMEILEEKLGEALKTMKQQVLDDMEQNTKEVRRFTEKNHTSS